MTRKAWMVPASVVLVFGFAACATSVRHDRVEPAALLVEIDAGRAPTIVDVRTRREYDAGHVPGAVHIPFYAVFAHEDELPIPRERTVVVYCAHGPRAGVAKLALWLAGYEDIRYLDGHMGGWKARGLPVQVSTSQP